MTESVHLLGLNQVDQLFRGLKETSMALARAPHGEQVYEHVEEPPALLAVPRVEEPPVLFAVPQDDLQNRGDEGPPTVLGLLRVEESPALPTVPGGEHQRRGDEAQAVRETEKSTISLRNLAL